MGTIHGGIGFEFMRISVDLTEEGLSKFLFVCAQHVSLFYFNILFIYNSKNLTCAVIIAHYQDVILTVFKYINLLKKDGVQSRIFEEVQSLASLAFRFKEKYPPSQYTSRLAGLMQHGYPAAYVLSGPSLIREYDPELIHENLSWVRPDNFRIMLASQTPPHGVEYTQKERWYGTEYNVLDFDEKLIEVKLNI